MPRWFWAIEIKRIHAHAKDNRAQKLQPGISAERDPDIQVMCADGAGSEIQGQTGPFGWHTPVWYSSPEYATCSNYAVVERAHQAWMAILLSAHDRRSTFVNGIVVRIIAICGSLGVSPPENAESKGKYMPEVSAESKRAHLLDAIQGEVLRRFPLLQSLEFSDQPQASPVRLPYFIGLLATVLETADRPCCIVLPNSKGVAIGVSTLIAITRLQNEFPEILRAHASFSFKPREDNVLVLPSDLVYRYEGFFTPTLFRLGVIDRKDARSLPVQEIARLEKTSRKRPKGGLNSDLGQSRHTILGSLLGVKITLNRNFLHNHVVVLGARRVLVEELDRWVVQLTVDGQMIRSSLNEEVPFGRIAEGGELCFLDGYIAAGEPLIAIGSRAQEVAANCTKAERFTKAVLVDDIGHLVRDLRAYDEITESQRTLILANDSERDSVRILKERGCEVWRLTPEEILLGIGSSQQNVPMQNLISKASNVRDLVISELCCSEESLDCAGVELQEAADTLSAIDNGTIRDLLYCLFRIEMFCAEYLGQDSEHFAVAADKLLELAKQHVQNAKVWLSPEANQHVKSALDNMQVAVSKLSEARFTPKGQLLLDSLKKSRLENNHVAVVFARAETDCVQLQQWLGNAGITTEVYAVGEVPENQNFGQVLVVSWPGAKRFDRLVHQYLTCDVRLLAYPFEERWLNQYRKGYKRSVLTGISSGRKRQLIGLSQSDTDNDETETALAEAHVVVKFDLPAEQFLTRRKAASVGESGDQEDLLDAYYVDFVGPTFAHLTEGHDLPVLNGFLSLEEVKPGKIPLRSVEYLKTGDYVMFRESGDSDIIRFLAEDEIGKDSYQRLRTTAGRWRTALRKLGNDPRSVWERLCKVGFSRHVQTVRTWLVDEGRICPQDIDDVRRIAEASQDTELLRILPELERARDTVMSLHISAGSRLTELLLKELPKTIGSLGHRETELDLGVGKVWVVRIQEIDRSPSAQRRSQLNRLLWDEKGI